MKLKKILGLSVAFWILFFPSCSKKEQTTYYRFIDHLSHEDILRSPFLQMADNPKTFKQEHPRLYEIAQKYPLQDFGINVNPFLIKKKIKIGPAEINSLFSPPRSHYRHPVRIPKNSFLEFFYGIIRDYGTDPSKNEKQTVQFSVSISDKENKSHVFRKVLTLRKDQSLSFNQKKISLRAYEGKKVKIDFITQGTQNALACWFNPVLYVPQVETRNVILISLDTLRPDHLGCYGYNRDTSPNIDQLARDSVVFLNSFATSPWTLPSHVSLMTALNCINHQVYHSDERMDPSLLTLADFLRTKGFHNYAITGGGYVSGLFGFNKGFDSYHVIGRIDAADAAQRASERVLNFIKRNQDKNFFLFLHSYQIHDPYSSPPPYNEMFLAEEATMKKASLGQMGLNFDLRYKPLSEKKKQNLVDLYDGEIRYTDETLIRPLVRQLKSLGLYDHTMIILTSDHGEEFYEHKSWSHSHSVYDETIKIPLIVKFFNNQHAGQKIAKYARIVDAMPTVLEVLNIDCSDHYLDGESLLNLLKKTNKNTEERVFLSEIASNARDHHIPRKTAINKGKNKLIINEDFSQQDLSYFAYPPPDVPELEIYNLSQDPRELSNLFKTNPYLARRLVRFMKSQYQQNKEVKTQKAEMNEKLDQQLRALGYIK